jgi:hypothetical protein
MDYKFKTMPYEHQLQALGAAHKKENFALFMEMGTGKSKVLIDNIAMLFDRGKYIVLLLLHQRVCIETGKGKKYPHICQNMWIILF